MKKILVLFLYYHFRKIAIRLSYSNALNLADLLGNIEYRLFQKKNKHFTSFLKYMFSGTPLEGREEELKKKCIHYRHRAFIFRTLPNQNQTYPVENAHILKRYDGRGICFPLVHFGYFYIGLSSLNRRLSVPLYASTIMKKTQNPLEANTIANKQSIMKNITNLKPIFNFHQFKTQCLVDVSNRKGCYAPTIDAATRTSKRYPFLGGDIVLSINASANFALKHRIPIMPYFILGEDILSLKIRLELPFDPGETAGTTAYIEQWYLSILEKYVLEYPEQVDWFFWWKNSERLKKRYGI